MNLLIQIVVFLAGNIIAKNLGNIDFAYFGVLQSDYAIFTAVADFGTTTLLLAFFGKNAVKGKLLDFAFQLRYALAFASMLLMAIFACSVRMHHPVFRAELILAFGLLFQHAFFDWYFICGKFWKKLLLSKVLHATSYAAVMGFSLFYLRTQSIEGIALSMVIAALPAWSFGATAALRPRILKFGHRSVQFIRLMLEKAFPFALSSLASFLYLPLGLYAMDFYAPREPFSGYNYAHKLILLASGLMVNFISSSLVSRHESGDSNFHVKDIATFTAFITLCASPAWICPEFCLKALFFASPIGKDPNILAFGASSLSILAFSVILQALRMNLVAAMLKEKRLWTYVAFIFLGGALNALAVFIAPRLGPGFQAIPFLALTGDVALSALLFGYFRKRFRR